MSAQENLTAIDGVGRRMVRLVNANRRHPVMATKIDWNDDAQHTSDLVVLRAVVAGVEMMHPRSGDEGCSLDDAALAVTERYHLNVVQADKARSILRRRAEFDAR